MATGPVPIALCTGDTVSGSELTVATLESELWSMASKWETLGRKLGLPEGSLRNIAADFPLGRGASKRRLNAVLDDWCNNATDGSWSDIVSALREIDESILAREIEMKYCSPAQVLSQTSSCVTQQEWSDALARENETMIKDRFAQLQTIVCRKIQWRLKTKKFKIKDFRIYMTNLFPPGDFIPKTTDVFEIFTAITNIGLWDYLNYQPLMRVANMYGGKDPDLMAKMEAYTKDLVGYKLVAKMANHLSNVPIMSSSMSEDEDQSSSNGKVRKDRDFRRKLTVKLNIQIEERSLVYVDEIWNSLSAVFRLPSSSAILEKIIKGSLYIMWLIPAVFVPQMMEIAKEFEPKIFQEMRITKITVDGVCLYEEEEESSAAVKSVEDDDDDEPFSHPHFPQPRVTGYDVELVVDSPDLHCPICLLVLRDPMQVSCCGKRFCRSCITAIVAEAKPCPACKCEAEHYIIFQDKAQKQAMSVMRVQCSNSDRGCSWRGELCQLDNHLNAKEKTGIGCQYVELKCIFCSEDCQHRHMRSCPKKSYTCPYCKHYSSTYDELNSNHLAVCKELPVQCKMCSRKTPRKSLQHHHLECEYPSYQSTAVPFKLTTVETPSPVFIPPPNFLMTDFTNYKKSGVAWYSPPFYSHLGGYKMSLRVDANGNGSSAGTHVSVAVCIMYGEYDESLPWPFRAEVTLQLVNQRRDEGHVETTVPFDDSAPEECTGRVTEGEIGRGCGTFQFIPHSALSYDESWNTEFLMSEDDSLEFLIQSVKLSKTAEGLPAVASDQPSSDAITAEQPELPPIPPVNIVMSNFISHKIHADSWFSPPFYSHIGGYKMCLRVDANGEGHCEGTDVSVRVHMMNGQYDGHLAWPFRGDITFHLVNQKMNKGHVEKTIFLYDIYAGRVTEGERAKRRCYASFIPHSALHYNASRNTEFLKKDTLILRVTQIQLSSSMGLPAEAHDQQIRDTEQPVSDRSSHDMVSASREVGESILTRSIEETHYSTAQGLSHTNELVIKDRFTQLQTVVCRKIEKRLNAKEIELKNFIVFMTALFPSLEFITETTDVSKIFTAITQNGLWDYLNYLPLERVSNMFGGKDPDLKAKLKAYTHELNEFKARTKMVSIVSVTGGQSSPTLARNDKQFHSELTVKLKVPITAQSLSYVDKVYKSLSRRFLLPPSSAILDKTTEDPVSVKWLIPAFFVPQMMEMAEQPQIIELFGEMKAEMVSVNGACLYGEQEEQEVSSDSSLDEEQEPPPKAEGLATAADSFCEESVELVSDEHRDTQAWSSSVCGVEKKQFNGEKVSWKQDKAATTTESFQEEGVDTTSDRELQETTQEESSLGVAEAAAVKSVYNKPSPHSHSHPEPHPPPHSPRPQVTGYDVELVKESPDLRCPICLLVFRDPIQVDCCGKRFCRSCIEAIIAESKPCPACKRTPGEYDFFDDKGQKQAILEVRVHCSNRKAGCSWKGELCQLDSHLNPKKGRKIDIGCPYAAVKCYHCSEDYHHSHMLSCPQQPYTCPYCKLYSSTYKDVRRHHLAKCEEFPVQCNECSMKIPRKALQHHYLECDGNKDPSHQICAGTAIALTVETPSPIFCPPPNIIMTEFTALKESVVRWYSPPFYSHIGGYKMCLRVDANGYGSGVGTHVSVFVCLMCGEYDDLLTWPFRGHVTIQLVNQKSDEGHVEHTVPFDGSDVIAGRVTEGVRTLGWGKGKFISHSALCYDESRNTEFLRSDTLEFQVTEIKVTTQI